MVTGSQRAVELFAMAGQDDRDEREEVETCRIALFRGYTTASFYACSTGNLAGRWIGEPSDMFPWRRRTGPDTPEARSAQLDLVSRLKEEGWVTAGQGDEWYELLLARAASVPSETDATVARDPEPPRLPTREPDPAPPLPPAQPSPPQPVLPVPVRLPRPARAVEAPRSGRRVDRWRVVAAAGLVTAIGLVGWAATHPSFVGAAPEPDQPMVARVQTPSAS